MQGYTLVELPHSGELEVNATHNGRKLVFRLPLRDAFQSYSYTEDQIKEAITRQYEEEEAHEAREASPDCMVFKFSGELKIYPKESQSGAFMGYEHLMMKLFPEMFWDVVTTAGKAKPNPVEDKTYNETGSIFVRVQKEQK